MKCHVHEDLFVFTSMQEPLTVPLTVSPIVGQQPSMAEQLLQEAIPASPSTSESKVLSHTATLSCTVDRSVAWGTVAWEMDVQFRGGYIFGTDCCGFFILHQEGQTQPALRQQPWMEVITFPTNVTELGTEVRALINSAAKIRCSTAPY